MSITEHLDALLAVLTTWGEEFGVVPTKAANREDVIQFCGESPTGLKAMLVCTGETMDDEQAQALVVWRSFSVVIIRPFGWTLHRGENLATGDATQSPLFTILESARNVVINAQVGEQDELWPRYTGLSQVDAGEVQADVWQLDFTAGALLAPLTA